jgi:hypothetical protein
MNLSLLSEFRKERGRHTVVVTSPLFVSDFWFRKEKTDEFK